MERGNSAPYSYSLAGARVQIKVNSAIPLSV